VSQIGAVSEHYNFYCSRPVKLTIRKAKDKDPEGRTSIRDRAKQTRGLQRRFCQE
jgi:hypothetical protein